jgi:glyoxylase-like metal-dependent hydrolase (beta-lactamase superfamily II)
MLSRFQYLCNRKESYKIPVVPPEMNEKDMLQFETFVFNLYQENTFVLWDDTGECVVMDPGCYSQAEKDELAGFIADKGLNVVYLLNTHGHIDHILGNRFVKETYKVPFLTHEKVVPALERAPAYGPMFGLSMAPSPLPDRFLNDGDKVHFGNTELEVLFVPGHSAGHIAFFHRESENLFSGDVLFSGSIGRTDLPGGSYPVLMASIVEKLLPLGPEVRVHCGHGSDTTLGREERTNPFILDYVRKKGN